MTPTESFISHLIELRNRLLKIVLGFVLVFFALFPFANKIYALLAAPMLAKLPAGGQMIATAVTTPFFVPMKVAMMAAFVISLPHTLYQIWAFVAPGLYSHEKKIDGACHHGQQHFIFSRYGVCLFCGVPSGIWLYCW